MYTIESKKSREILGPSVKGVASSVFAAVWAFGILKGTCGPEQGL